MDEAHHAFVDDVETGIADGGLEVSGQSQCSKMYLSPSIMRLRGSSDFIAQWTTSIQWVKRSVMAPPPKFQNQRQR